jgi:hypothetical protein
MPSRDATREWGTTDAKIAQTVQVIDFLASRSTHPHSSLHCACVCLLNSSNNEKQQDVDPLATTEIFTYRYVMSPSLFAVELMNEPLAPRATLDNLTMYYRDGYDAVRKHSSTAFCMI